MLLLVFFALHCSSLYKFQILFVYYCFNQQTSIVPLICIQSNNAIEILGEKQWKTNKEAEKAGQFRIVALCYAAMVQCKLGWLCSLSKNQMSILKPDSPSPQFLKIKITWQCCVQCNLLPLVEGSHALRCGKTDVYGWLQNGVSETPGIFKSTWCQQIIFLNLKTNAVL